MGCMGPFRVYGALDTVLLYAVYGTAMSVACNNVIIISKGNP